MVNKVEGLHRVIYGIGLFTQSHFTLHSIREALEWDKEHEESLKDGINYVLYTYLLHARKIYEFFLNSKGRQGDIKAHQFCQGLSIKEDKRFKQDLDKLVMHFTYHPQEEVGWYIEDIAVNLFGICKDFLENEFWKEYNIEAKYSERRKEIIQYLKKNRREI